MTDDSEQERWTDEELAEVWENANTVVRRDVPHELRDATTRRLRGGEGERLHREAKRDVSRLMRVVEDLETVRVTCHNGHTSTLRELRDEENCSAPCCPRSGCGECSFTFEPSDALSPTDGEDLCPFGTRVDCDGCISDQYPNAPACPVHHAAPDTEGREEPEFCGFHRSNVGGGGMDYYCVLPPGHDGEHVTSASPLDEWRELRREHTDARPEEAGGEDDGYTDEDLEWAFDILLPDKPPVGEIDKVRDYEEKRTALDCIRDRLRRPPEGAGDWTPGERRVDEAEKAVREVRAGRQEDEVTRGLDVAISLLSRLGTEVRAGRLRTGREERDDG